MENNLHNLKGSYNLLLNLLLRESDSWYFFNIVPRYDEYLAIYMESCSDVEFVCFNLKQNKNLYFSIRYKSLSGMHVFGETIAVRDKKFGKIEIISPKKALVLLIKAYFPEFELTDLHFIQNLKDVYDTLVQTQLLNIIPQALFVSDQDVLTGRCIDIKNYLKEYSNKEDLDALFQLICEYAQNMKTDVNKATQKWLEHYILCLLDSTIKEYVEQGKIITPNLSNISLRVDKNGQATNLIFSDRTLVYNSKDLPEFYCFDKIERFLQAQLLTHNVFPLIRAFGLLGLHTEECLLEVATNCITAFWEQYPDKKNFIMGHKIHIDTFVPSILSIQNSEYFRSHVHEHNHLINSKYYSPNLIKPQKGMLVHKRYFENSTMEIGIRAFNIETDIEILHEWVNKDYAKKFWEMDGPIEELEEAYIKHLGVDYSHPYIGTLNGEPIFTLELYWAIKDEVGKYYPFHPGDYGFHMLVAPAKKKINNFSYYALTMCMEYFFSHTQVHRMIGEASVEHTGTHNLITKVGCEFNKALTLPYKTSNLTFLNRAMYKESVQDVLNNSCTEIYLKV